MSDPTPHDLAHLHLRRDPVLAALIELHGELPALPISPDPFATLVRSVIGQQLSVKAAASIAARLELLAPGFQAADLAALSEEQLRAVGFSRAKVRTVHALAARVADGTLDFERLQQATDEQVIEALIPIPGIGRWTAEMFLMFALARPDVFAWGDLGLRRGLERHYSTEMAEQQRAVAAWAPQRSLAARYLWRSLNNAPT